ncbi:MAG: hypothetical protein AB8B91_20430 [Rubripirellula sp.]
MKYQTVIRTIYRIQASSVASRFGWKLVATILATWTFAVCASAEEQKSPGPTSVMLLGARVSGTESLTNNSKAKRTAPRRLPTIEKPTRLPVPSSPPSLKPSELPKLSEAQKQGAAAASGGLANSDSSRVTLAPPQAIVPVLEQELKQGLPFPSTDYDVARFDKTIDATVASTIFDRGLPLSRQLKSGCDGACTSACQTCQEKSKYYSDFSPTPMSRSMSEHPCGEQWVYDVKRDVPTQHPWIEWGRIWYGDGITPRGKNWFGDKNLARPQFYMYGDYRTGIAAGRNAAGRTDNWAHRLNLDLDLRLTDSERFHAFVGPLDNGGQFSRFEKVSGDFRFRNEIDFTPLTGYFEGDAGVLLGAAHDQTSPFELPFTIGLVPLLFQNGIWMEDAVTGAAFALPARHSRLLNWSNFDATFFAVVDQLDSAAFAGDEHAAQAFGTAWFIEAYAGYIETGYAYLRDRNQSERSYHNITASYTRRYFDRISNSVRVIVNAGQDLPDSERTADGALLLVENSWITSSPLTFVPYANFFVGWDRPQSVARAGGSGGVLRNTGINFDSDGLNGLSTLDATASDTAGGSIGVDLIGDDLDRQLLLEMTYLTPHGSKNANVPDDQFAAGARYQFPVSNATLLRFDTMYGWRRGLEDVYGTRMEYRWKF